ncbi:MAG TPA: GFA family protein [Devosia sp.]|jgi:hypothetical protein|nr:GFA family protein [Devosia sp.]
MPKGSCLCGAVTFTVRGQLPAASACHCTRCRKATGHYEAGVDVKKSDVSIQGIENITWYYSSGKVRRGFCCVGGSPLFFDPPAADWIGLMLGTFDGPTGTKISSHVFVKNKGDYYTISDGVPQYATVPKDA